jgi:hypothetical protein
MRTLGGVGYSRFREQSENLGDPTLRLQIVAPPPSLSVITNGLGQPVLNWTISPQPVLGYWAYRASGSLGPFTNRITSTVVTGFTFVDTDPAALSGSWTYLVRALALEPTGSGTFTNLSQGIRATLNR